MEVSRVSVLNIIQEIHMRLIKLTFIKLASTNLSQRIDVGNCIVYVMISSNSKILVQQVGITRPTVYK